MTQESVISERALTMLGSGAGPEIVASALGVTTSAISQLMAEEGYKNRVLELRYKNLSKHIGRDNKADELEDVLLDKLKSSLSFIMDPGKLLMAYRVINAAKRRSSSAPEAIVSSQPVQSITMPTMIVQQFTTNIHNQIVRAGETDLTTIQSGKMDQLLLENSHGNVKTIPVPALTI